MARTFVNDKRSISQGDQLLTSALRCALYGDGGNRIEQMAAELVDLALNGSGDVPHHVRLAAIKAIYDQQGGHLPRVIFDPPVQLHLPLIQ